MGAILEEGEVEGGALRTSTNVSWTQHGHMLDIKGVCVLANPWISFVFPARCRAKTFGVLGKECADLFTKFFPPRRKKA